MRYRQAPSVMSKVAVSLLFVAVLVALGDGKTGDHGGIPMGVQTIKCDDAKTYIEIDWDPNSTEEYTCDGDIIVPSKPTIDSHCEKNPQEGIHVCYPSTIQYSDLPPTSGWHRPNWPDYGEYKYVPPQRWLHNMEHGAIVMLYHPCADPAQVDMLRGIVTHCLRKHIITPYKQLPEQTPFALLSWGCKLMMSTVVSSVARNFIKTHAKMAPEGRVASKGQYTQSRIVAAATVSDYDDNTICPPDPKNAEDQGTEQNGQNAADSTNTGNQNEQSPPQRPANAIVLQSQRRQQRLNAEADKLHQNVENLIKAYRRLISQT